MITIKCAYVNLSPDAFQLWANHYYKCKQDFQSPSKFSPVPYFLLCRSIELTLKARHLHGDTKKAVKDKFSHNLKKCYDALKEDFKLLNKDEYKVLKFANKIYSKKGFEYFNAEHAIKGYKNYPELNKLDVIAKKLIDSYV
ncbi:hypothetical protein [Spartinivicinus ruber]|uniref:hypothetical protein n=1 Tax=Spartinivicinus ruber TaxID=2683272 RepID=UPI0013D35F2B|nr:hypothetical protein [Spartinivicinus ruber]